MMKLKEVTEYLETIAPLNYQESYDNSGWIVGSPDEELNSVLVNLDCTPEVVDEAIELGANLIITHHPIIFKGLKKITGKNYIEKTVIKAIRNDIALYAIHTNLDNVLQHGVNQKIAEKLGLSDLRILQPKEQQLLKLVFFVPKADAEQVRNAVFASGAGSIGAYSNCSFNLDGVGTFLPGEATEPHVGEKGKEHREPETRVEVIVPEFLKTKVTHALIAAHPYEEVAFDWYQLQNSYAEIGSGLVGTLPQAMQAHQFMKHLKEQMRANVIRHTDFVSDSVKTVALCGGSGSFLLNAAIGVNADVFITGDFKYHEFFDANGKITIADIGHHESEQFTSELIKEILTEKFSTFAVHLSKVNTNPIHYFY